MNAPGDGCQPGELISEAEVLLAKEIKFWESLAKTESERAASKAVGIFTSTSEEETSNIDNNTGSSLPSIEDIVYTLTSEEKMEHGCTLDREQVENRSNLQLT
eukprot:12067861-Ditylum_brightwellii.AAC.1